MALERQPPDPAMFSEFGPLFGVRDIWSPRPRPLGEIGELHPSYVKASVLAGASLYVLYLIVTMKPSRRGLGDFAAVKVSSKDPAEMSAAAINKELDAINKKESPILDQLIAAGRGSETSSETYKQSDPLSLDLRALRDRRTKLQIEIHLRAGPGVYRMPKGFGPRKDRY